MCISRAWEGRVHVATCIQTEAWCKWPPADGGRVMWLPAHGARVHVATCRRRKGAFRNFQTEARCMWPLVDGGRGHVAT
jgi:hypothetical protein